MANRTPTPAEELADRLRVAYCDFQRAIKTLALPNGCTDEDVERALLVADGLERDAAGWGFRLTAYDEIAEYLRDMVESRKNLQGYLAQRAADPDGPRCQYCAPLPHRIHPSPIPARYAVDAHTDVEEWHRDRLIDECNRLRSLVRIPDAFPDAPSWVTTTTLVLGSRWHLCRSRNSTRWTHLPSRRLILWRDDTAPHFSAWVLPKEYVPPPDEDDPQEPAFVVEERDLVMWVWERERELDAGL